MSCKTVTVPRWKLQRAADLLGNDGDEYGVGADIESVLAAADRVNWRTCVTHGDENPHVWGCPECLRELREENRRLRAAMEKHCATLVMLPEQDDRVDRERVVKETLRFKDEFLTPNALAQPTPEAEGQREP